MEKILDSIMSFLKSRTIGRWVLTVVASLVMYYALSMPTLVFMPGVGFGTRLGALVGFVVSVAITLAASAAAEGVFAKAPEQSWQDWTVRALKASATVFWASARLFLVFIGAMFVAALFVAVWALAFFGNDSSSTSSGGWVREPATEPVGDGPPERARDFRHYDAGGKYAGQTVDGRHYDAAGNYAGQTVDGRRYDAGGAYVGQNVDGKLYDAAGNYTGQIVDGRHYDAGGSLVGQSVEN